MLILLTDEDLTHVGEVFLSDRVVCNKFKLSLIIVQLHVSVCFCLRLRLSLITNQTPQCFSKKPFKFKQFDA